MNLEMLGLMRVKNEEKYLERTLAAVTFVDLIILLDDHSTDRTREIASSFRNVWVVPSMFSETHDEGRDRQFLAEMASKLKPKWIVALSGDEVLEPAAWEKFQQWRYTDVSVVEVKAINFWNDENTVRVDGHWSNQWRQVFWKWIAGLPLQYDRSHGSLPTAYPDRQTVRWIESNIGLWHLGFIEASRRRRNYDLYVSENPAMAKHSYNLIQGDPGGPTPEENWSGEPFRLQTVEAFLKETGQYTRSL
jgi:glycosyltransferase involved in cell wall biosynthesis